MHILQTLPHTIVLCVTLFGFRFILLCFPWSNTGHPIHEALFLLLGKILVNVDMSSRRSALSALFVASLATDGVLITKCYCPDLLFFLRKTISHRQLQENLSDQVTSSGKSRFAFQELFPDKADGLQEMIPSGEDRHKMMLMCVALLGKLVPVHSEFPAYAELFGDFLEMTKKVKTGENLVERVEALEKLVASYRQPRKYLQFLKKPPAPLQLLEPRIDTK